MQRSDGTSDERGKVEPHQAHKRLSDSRFARGRAVQCPLLKEHRFRSELIRKYPSLVADLKYRRWDRLDSQIATLLQRKGLRAHQHEPAVIHHHNYGE